MKVSIITICKNSETTIERTIKSVLTQRYSEIEYIVIDGASEDDTMQIVRSYDHRIDKVVSEKDAGMYEAINKGISLATGDVVALLHSDDMYIDDKVVTKVVRAFRETNTDAVYSDLVYVDRHNTNIITRFWKSCQYTANLFKKGWMPAHPTFFVKREKFHELGMYKPELKFSADYELMLRFIHKHNISTHYLPEITVLMRQGGRSNHSVSNRIKANLEESISLIKI